MSDFIRSSCTSADDVIHSPLAPRGVASTFPDFPESLYWRRSARRYVLLGLVSWMLSALSCVVFMAVLLAARWLFPSGFVLVPLACGLACAGRWCDRSSRDAWDFAFWSLHADLLSTDER